MTVGNILFICVRIFLCKLFVHFEREKVLLFGIVIFFAEEECIAYTEMNVSEILLEFRLCAVREPVEYFLRDLVIVAGRIIFFEIFQSFAKLITAFCKFDIILFRFGGIKLFENFKSLA